MRFIKLLKILIIVIFSYEIFNIFVIEVLRTDFDYYIVVAALFFACIISIVEHGGK